MSTQWFYSREGNNYGPYTLEEMQYFLQTGNIYNNDLVWSEHLGEWRRVDTVPELSGSADAYGGEVIEAGSPVKAQKKKSFTKLAIIGGAALLIVVAAFILVRFIGLPFGGGDKVLISETVQPSEDAQVFGRADEIRITIPGDMLDEPADLNVTLRGNFSAAPQDAQLDDTYNITLGSYDELAGVLEIEIPYDPASIPQGVNPGDYIGALYYNEVSGEWEHVVYEVNPQKNTITIFTYHLSEFARVRRSSTDPDSPMARVRTPIYLPGSAYTADPEEIADMISSMGSGGAAGDSAIKAGWDAAAEMFGVMGPTLTFMEEVFEVGTLNTINNWMGDLGLGLAFVQLAINLDGQNPAPAVLTFTKDLGNYAIGKWGTSAMKIASVGVFAIDYSLNKFATTAIAGREQMYVDAYSRYYYRGSDYSTIPGFKVRNNVDWYKTFYKITNQAPSPEEAEKMIAEEINRYVYAFWNDTDGMTFAFSDTSQGFTYSGGSNQALEKRIAENHKAELVNSLQPVFQRLAKQIRIERQQSYYNNEVRRIGSLLNSVYTLRVTVIPSEIDGQPVSVEGMPVMIGTGRNQALWQGETDKDGIWEMKFTLLGLLNAEPTGLVVLSGLGPDGKDTMEAEFKLKEPGARVDVTFNLDEIDLTGRWEGYWVMTYCAILDENPAVAQEAAEGCEEAMGAGIVEMIQEVFRSLLNVDVPMVLEFQPTDVGDSYTGTIVIQFDQVLPDGVSADEEPQSFKAVYKDGKISFSLADQGWTTVFEGTAQGSDSISGTFNVPSGSGSTFMSGTWRAVRAGR
ncbi:MAG: DUF4339 domain-containing protein [Bacillota bacterium]|nr:DUF4339 domain-containing protein [Bacillota bacterium]